MPTLYLPEMLLVDGHFRCGVGVLVGDDGSVAATADAGEIADMDTTVVRLPGKALLPGMVNAHSHAFQRLIRGRSETRGDNFWTWRNLMYAAHSQLTPEEMYGVARMAFLEMALAGITTVGDFHYVHRQPDGTAFADPNEMAKSVIAAARSVGIRICLLRSAYFRAGFKAEADPGQARFYEPPLDFLAASDALRSELGDSESSWMGVAPHSVRAVPADDIVRIARWAGAHNVPLHIHAAEQQAELEASVAEYGTTPVALLAARGVLGANTTLIHAVHVSDAELNAIAAAGSTICACPTTERNLGDGIVRARDAADRAIPFALGTDSQTQIGLLEDARGLEYHLRLQHQQRLLLDGMDGKTLAERVFGYATAGGANALAANSGTLAPGESADFFTVDLRSPEIAGTAPEHLLAAIVFTQQRAGICDVAVQGKLIVQDGQHAEQQGIVTEYEQISARVWQQ